jgi:WD40 repeat protein
MGCATGQELLTIEGQGDFCHGLAFSPDGRWIASGSGVDPAAKIWDAQTGQLVRTHNTAGGMYDLAFSPDGSLVAYALNHGGEVVSVAFSPHGSLLAAAGCDRTVKLWGAASGKLLNSSTAAQRSNHRTVALRSPLVA